MIWINIAFWILFGFLLTGWIGIPSHELIVGILALIIGFVMLLDYVVPQWRKNG